MSITSEKTDLMQLLDYQVPPSCDELEQIKEIITQVRSGAYEGYYKGIALHVYTLGVINGIRKERAKKHERIKS